MASFQAQSPVPTSGLLFVYTERGSAITDEEFEDWYDNEHIPLRMNLPGPLFRSCTRWLAADGKTPTHLALYGLSSPEAILEPPYAALSTSRSTRELDILDKLAFLDRRVYAPLPSTLPPREGYDPRAPGPYVSILELTVREDDVAGEAELNKWYEEEHIPMISQVPGYVRTRRFVANRVLSVTGTSVDVLVPRHAPGKYLALHEWASMDAFETEEFKKAADTPWRTKVLQSNVVVRFERRVFKFLRGWGGSGEE